MSGWKQMRLEFVLFFCWSIHGNKIIGVTGTVGFEDRMDFIVGEDL